MLMPGGREGGGSHGERIFSLISFIYLFFGWESTRKNIWATFLIFLFMQIERDSENKNFREVAQTFFLRYSLSQK